MERQDAYQWKPKEVPTFDRSMTSSQLFASATRHNSYYNFYLLGVSRESGNRLYGGYMWDCQNYGPFLGPYYNTGPNTGPNLGDPKRDHNFDNPLYRDYIPTNHQASTTPPKFYADLPGAGGGLCLHCPVGVVGLCFFSPLNRYYKSSSISFHHYYHSICITKKG